MNRLVISRWRNQILTILFSNQKPIDIQIECENSPSILHNIYIGKVVNIVKSLNAAFVEIEHGIKGYYSLSENEVHHFVRGSGKLKAGDEIIVQVEKDFIKSKAPVLTSNLNFTGQSCVLTSGKTSIGFSGKIKDVQWKELLKEELLKEKSDTYGVIIRTNAKNSPPSEIIKEMKSLELVYHQVLEDSLHRTCYTCLVRSEAFYLKEIRDTYHHLFEEVVTDDAVIFQRITSYVSTYDRRTSIRLYEDSLLPLSKLYSIDRVMEQVLSKKVWLKSGGYLIIEPTEALVVIDVNTGKYAGKKNVKETIWNINCEAAKEAARQIRLRNLSGIILIDFIDMVEEEEKKQLTNLLEKEVSLDPIKTTVLGMSKLNLMEMTRKKTKKTIHQQLYENENVHGETIENY